MPEKKDPLLLSGKFVIKIEWQQAKEKSSLICTHLVYYWDFAKVVFGSTTSAKLLTYCKVSWWDHHKLLIFCLRVKVDLFFCKNYSDEKNCSSEIWNFVKLRYNFVIRGLSYFHHVSRMHQEKPTCQILVILPLKKWSIRLIKTK